MGSSRFPGKPLAKINGKPMIGHVYDRVCKSASLTMTAVATCDEEIFNYITSIGGFAIMTSSLHERASDRCAEALLAIEKEKNITFDIVVMVQGDEPLTHPDMVTQAVEPMISDQSILVLNLMSRIKSSEEFNDRNCIKVVFNRKSDALYFSREPIPNQSNINYKHMFKQVCIIPFRRDFLIEYNKLEPTPLEIAESIDMMRVLENGLNVRMVQTNFDTHAVDVIEDIEIVEKMMKVISLPD